MVSVADPQALRQIHMSHKFTKASIYEALKIENEYNMLSFR
jgi:hypothetical protein